jgi:hypothetical protein
MKFHKRLSIPIALDIILVVLGMMEIAEKPFKIDLDQN